MRKTRRGIELRIVPSEPKSVMESAKAKVGHFWPPRKQAGGFAIVRLPYMPKLRLPLRQPLGPFSAGHQQRGTPENEERYRERASRRRSSCVFDLWIRDHFLQKRVAFVHSL